MSRNKIKSMYLYFHKTYFYQISQNGYLGRGASTHKAIWSLILRNKLEMFYLLFRKAFYQRTCKSIAG